MNLPYLLELQIQQFIVVDYCPGTTVHLTGHGASSYCAEDIHTVQKIRSK